MNGKLFAVMTDYGRLKIVKNNFDDAKRIVLENLLEFPFSYIAVLENGIWTDEIYPEDFHLYTVN